MAVGIEQLVRPVAFHPLFENAHMSRILVHLAHWHLVRAPIVLGAFAVDLLRAGPPLGRAKHDHRPAGTLLETVLTRVGLDALNVGDNGIERGAISSCIFSGSSPSTKYGV